MTLAIDAYFCPRCDGGTVICRYGDEPREYASTPIGCLARMPPEQSRTALAFHQYAARSTHLMEPDTARKYAIETVRTVAGDAPSMAARDALEAAIRAEDLTALADVPVWARMVLAGCRGWGADARNPNWDPE